MGPIGDTQGREDGQSETIDLGLDIDPVYY